MGEHIAEGLTPFNNYRYAIMAGMSVEDLKKRCLALAGVGDAAAAATLVVIERMEKAEEGARNNDSAKAFGVSERELNHAKYVLSKIGQSIALAKDLIPDVFVPPARIDLEGLSAHAVEVASYDKKAKEYYADIVDGLVKAANRTRLKSNAMPFPRYVEGGGPDVTLSEYFNSYIDEYGEKNRLIEFLNIMYQRDTGKRAPQMPADWKTAYYAETETTPQAVPMRHQDFTHGDPETATSAARDKIVKEYYSDIIVELLRVANNTRSESNQIEMPTLEPESLSARNLISHFEQYVPKCWVGE